MSVAHVQPRLAARERHRPRSRDAGTSAICDRHAIRVRRARTVRARRQTSRGAFRGRRALELAATPTLVAGSAFRSGDRTVPGPSLVPRLAVHRRHAEELIRTRCVGAASRPEIPLRRPAGHARHVDAGHDAHVAAAHLFVGARRRSAGRVSRPVLALTATVSFTPDTQLAARTCGAPRFRGSYAPCDTTAPRRGEARSPPPARGRRSARRRAARSRRGGCRIRRERARKRGRDQWNVRLRGTSGD